MKKTLYLVASFLFLASSGSAQSGDMEQVPGRELSKSSLSKENIRVAPDNKSSRSAARAACDGDTLLYEDFANGFAGNNSQAIGWDTSGTYLAWRDCGMTCPTNGSTFNLAPSVNAPNTAGNGLIHMDIQWKAGYIYGPGQSPPGEPEGPAPEQHMTMDDVVDLSTLKAPVLTLQSTFVHCCALDHQVLVEVDTNMSGNWDTSFDLSANVGRNTIEDDKFTYHLGPAIKGNADSVRIRFSWPATGPDANGQVSGVYSWYFDDLVIRDANRNDLATGNTTYIPENSNLYNADSIPIEYTQIPRCHYDCMNLGAQICNLGRNDLNNVQLEATAFDANTGTQIFQSTSAPMALDSISCIGGAISGYRPPAPDTVFGASCMPLQDTGSYAIEYRAITDTADCDPSNNLGLLEEFMITERTFAVDACGNDFNPSSPVVSPAGGGGYKESNAYVTYEFNWGNASEDTVKQVCVYIDDTTQVGAGPITVGISNREGPVYRKSSPYYITAADTGSFVCLDLTLDSNNSQVGGLPVPVGDNALKTAFVKYGGGSSRIGYGTCGNAQDFHAWVQGDFGGGGFAVYGTGDVPMVRVKMNQPDLTIDTTACDSFTVPSGDETYYSSGMYQDTAAGFVSCGNAFNIDLTINNSTSETIARTACNSYTVPSGDETYNSAGTYMDTIPTDAGCDSMLTINLSLGTPDTSVSEPSTGKLEANLSGANSYQWIDCSDNSTISNATSQSFTPETVGNYAVIVDQGGGCKDTSNCHYIDETTGIADRQADAPLDLYPNPTKGNFTLDLGKAGRDMQMKITDLQGRVVEEQSNINSRRVQFELDQPEGVYLVHLSNDSNNEIIKLVKK